MDYILVHENSERAEQGVFYSDWPVNGVNVSERE